MTDTPRSRATPARTRLLGISVTHTSHRKSPRAAPHTAREIRVGLWFWSWSFVRRKERAELPRRVSKAQRARDEETVP